MLHDEVGGVFLNSIALWYTTSSIVVETFYTSLNSLAEWVESVTTQDIERERERDPKIFSEIF